MPRRSRDIGIEATPPTKECNDEKCPWHGSLRIRGRMFEGTVIRRKEKGATVEWEYTHYVPKYERYERRRTRIYAYVPPCIAVQIGDKVRVAECRPISKTKRFVVIEVVKKVG